jgi:hypothetical protein
MATLTLALKLEYFEAIRDGTKLEEYRLVTPYWRKRLEGKNYDSIVLTHGYPRTNEADRRIERPWNGFRIKTITHPHFGEEPVEVFAIDVRPRPGNPYFIQGPAAISFSGGRTSAYMLYQILQAHGGKLPDDVIVTFANTGKEREETLRFVHECGSRWNVKIHWLEWRKGKPGFEEVGYNSAARNGEPFAALIADKQRLPNSFERWCTEFLKVKPMIAFAAALGWTGGAYAEVIGLRHDEGRRIFKGLANAEKFGRRCIYPLSKAKAIKADVMAFWLGKNVDPKNLEHPLPQGFDLGLEPWEGNCDLCFLKGKGIRKRIIREKPSRATWWNYWEKARDGWFDKRDTVAELIAQVERTPTLFDEFDAEEYDTECGDGCMEAAE